ncbi:MAG: glucose-1-phosphate thymidylyltransferase, partial [Nitrososphaeria archaeon]
VIGKNTLIEDSYVGPFSSVGSNVAIRGSKIDNSIIMDGSQIENIELDSCLIGRKVSIKGQRGKGNRLRLSLGDYSMLEVE